MLAVLREHAIVMIVVTVVVGLLVVAALVALRRAVETPRGPATSVGGVTELTPDLGRAGPGGPAAESRTGQPPVPLTAATERRALELPDSPPPAVTTAPPAAPSASPPQEPIPELGDQLHSGGCGVWVLNGRRDRVFREVHCEEQIRPEVFDRLAECGRSLQDSLTGRGLHIRLCFPDGLATFGGIHGTVAPRIADPFVDHAGYRAVPRTLNEALPSANHDVGPQVRLDLVRLIGELLAAMHERSLVLGDLSWTNFTFTAGPPTEVAAHDFALTRLLGDPPLGRSWPLGQKPGRLNLATLDTDRHGYAVLVCGLLNSEKTDQPVHGLDQRQLSRLVALSKRALGRPGSRPQIAEWLGVLGPVSARPDQLARAGG